MTETLTRSARVLRPDGQTGHEVNQRLLDSAAQLSYDPALEVDWDAPLDPDLYGLNPEWSTLYGTRLWDEMSHQQRVTLTRHEVGSIMSTGIWFEMILQQMLLRDLYCKDATRPGFQFGLTEIADECRHSIMFARACQKMGVPGYLPRRSAIELGRVFKATAFAETAFAAMLVAEEVLDVMQRDWMRGDDVLPMVRTTSKIHVVEESRHMAFARQQVRERLDGLSRARRHHAGTVLGVAAHIIVGNMVNRGVYAAAGLDPQRALAEAKGNSHHHAMMRNSSQHLMAFLGESHLITKPAEVLYKNLHML